MRISKRDAAKLVAAIYTAIESREALIECHRTEWGPGLDAHGQPYKIFPARYKRLVDGWRRSIDAWAALAKRIRQEADIL